MRFAGLRSERGATGVEYALGLALFVLLIIGGLELVQRGAEETLAEDRSATLRTEHLGTVAPTTSSPSTVPGPSPTVSTTTTTTNPTSTSSSSTTTSTTSSTTTTTVANPVLRVSCVDTTCTFWVDNAPPGSTYSWTSTEGAGSGTASSFSHTRPRNAGDYQVTVRLGNGWSATARIDCPQGNHPCEAA